jgi:hypothetical protein
LANDFIGRLTGTAINVQSLLGVIVIVGIKAADDGCSRTGQNWWTGVSGTVRVVPVQVSGMNCEFEISDGDIAWM